MELPPLTAAQTEAPYIRVPNPQTLFHHRAARFRQLALSQASLVGYLNLMADLADSLHHLSARFSPALLPDSCAGRPPLDISSWRRDPAWRDALRSIVEDLSSGGGPLGSVRDRLKQATDEQLESWADDLLAADFDRLDVGLAPFVAAALQVNWTVLASRLDAGKIGATEAGHLCPVCGSLPVASVLQTGGAVQGLRYLVCDLCATEWNRPRIHCINCGSSKEVAYFGLEGTGEAVQAEACGQCKTYVKLVNREKEPQVDPFADDLATLALDVLMAEEGYQRLGFNPLLIPGG
ncbi:formate dehydrogenase accessory protein FdhE [Methylococcus sp. EFPC2]|uniref:formate dehydrogenase accessory protein FdhE n=1 Tax=Methylococcus sp. EFPC2 TaxID=2812648 RepID=UPI0019672508|nr:formate dehydrogenase accessory protein FdhE [Methylococcus sp. EFPC2]QSA96165.1 formate dehydrogenase accessory protein FdhE [Methylococcus sp. EFPC2]